MKRHTTVLIRAVAWSAAFAGIGALVATGGVTIFICLLIAAALAYAVVMPKDNLPALALMLFAFIPIKYLNIPLPLKTFTPSLVLIVVWSARVLVSCERLPLRFRGDRRIMAYSLLLTWTLIGVLRAPAADRVSSFGWTVSFLVALAIPLFASSERIAISRVRRAWLYSGAVIGAYAILEWFLRGNIIFGAIYEAASPSPLTQHWSVYRSTATLGHPLANAVFLAVATVLALGEWLTHRTRIALIATVLCAIGTMATASRGAAIALAIGFIITTIGAMRADRRSRRTAAAVGVLVMMVLVVGVGGDALRSRNDSREAMISSAYRREALVTGTEMVRSSPVLGVGAGLAGQTKERAGGTYRNQPFENSWLELAVALGIPSVIILGYILYIAAAAAARAGDWAIPGAIVAYSISAGGFNYFEGHRPAHLVLGLLLAMAYATRPYDGSLDEPLPRKKTEHQCI